MRFFSTSTLLLLALCTSGAQAGIFDFLNFLPAADQVFEQKDCNATTRSDAECNLTPFSGVYMCRSFFSIAHWESKHNVCVRNFSENVTLGFSNDECGCCDGACPPPCPCDCGKPDENGVYPSKLIKPVLIFDRTLPAICAPNGVARQLTLWGGRVQCETKCGGGAEPTEAPDANVTQAPEEADGDE